MRYVVGSDEVGLGALAGPLVVCAVVVPEDWPNMPFELRDSKKLSDLQRARIADVLEPMVTDMCMQFFNSREIDEMGVHWSLMEAHRRALSDVIGSLPRGAQYRVIIDGVHKPKGIRCEAIPKADDLFPAVSAASVLAKVRRDTLMIQHHKTYPLYGFNAHKGYPTAQHKSALTEHGPCPLHRRSYEPVRIAEALHAR